MNLPRRPTGVSPYRAQLESLVEQLVANGLPDDDRLPLAMTRVGDALRAGISVPRPLLAAIASSASLAPLLAECALETAGWQMAWMGPPLEGLGEHVLRRRDEMTSLVVITRRVALLQDVDPPLELDALVRALRAIDAQLRPLLAPTTVADALVDRTLDDGWYRDFGGVAEVGVEASDAGASPPFAYEVESPEAIVAYVAAGAGRAAVELWANASSEASEDLGTIIDTALGAYEPVCFVARLWRRAHGRSGSLLRFRPAALAAADEVLVSAEQHTLGSFAPIEAEGTLEVSGHTITLRVFPEHPEAVVGVWLGDRQAVVPLAGQPWMVEHPRTAGSAAIRVRISGGGHQIDEALPLADT